MTCPSPQPCLSCPPVVTCPKPEPGSVSIVASDVLLLDRQLPISEPSPIPMPLHIESQRGNLPEIQRLIAKGHSPMRTFTTWILQSDLGLDAYSAFHVATHYRNNAAAKWLANYSPEVRQQRTERGKTAEWIAAQTNNLELLEHLVPNVTTLWIPDRVLNESIGAQLVRLNHTDTAKYFALGGRHPSPATAGHVVATLLKHQGNLSTIQWVVRNTGLNLSRLGCVEDPEASFSGIAAFYGRTDVLDWISISKLQQLFGKSHGAHEYQYLSYYAIRGGFPQSVEWILANGYVDELGLPPAAAGEKIVKEILDAPGGHSIAHFAAKPDVPIIMLDFIHNSALRPALEQRSATFGMTAFHMMIVASDRPKATWWIATVPNLALSDLDHRGRNPAHYAAETGDAPFFGWLAPQLTPESLDTPDKYGTRPSHLASLHGHLDILTQLVVEFNVTADKSLADSATKGGHAPIITFLSSRGITFA